MRLRLLLLAFSCVPLTAQQSLPVGIMHGHLLALNDHPSPERGARSSGDLVVQAADGTTYGCAYDAHTLFERDHDVIRADHLRPGDPVEVVSDRRTGGCYTRMLTVNDLPVPKMSPARRPAGRLVNLQPRGYVTISGLVVRANETSITVRTRSGEKTLLLRADTLYSIDGVRLDAPESALNKHVFIRAGRDLHETLEAYQVMWGEALLVP
ncbi:MAG: hypothetical protein ABL995_12815 [Bryobacteraceae bacterium]